MLQRAARSLLSKAKFPKPTKPIISQTLQIHPKSTPRSHLSNPIHPHLTNKPSSIIPYPRNFTSSAAAGADINNEVDEINLKFAEAREEIEAALDSKETVYFNEEAECAREAVKVVMDKYDGLLARLEDKDKMGLQRSMGLKMEQLKAELKQLDD